MWEYLQKFLEPEIIALIGSVLAAAGSVIKMARTVITLSKEKKEAVQDVVKQIYANMQNNINDALQPIIPELQKVQLYMQTFSKAFVLMQDNRPEARLAVLQLIQELGETNINDVKQAIEEEMQVNEEEKQEKIEKLEEIAVNGRY